MKKQVITSSKLPQTSAPYSPAIQAGPLLFVSGILATDFKHPIAPEAQVSPDFPYYGSPAKRETEYILNTMKTLIGEAGCSMSDVMRIGTYHRDMSEMPGIAEVRRQFWSTNPPSSTAMKVGLAIPAARLEIDAIVGVPSGGAKPEVVVDDRLARPALFSQAFKTNGLMFAAGILASDFKTGLFEQAKVNSDDFPFHVSPVKAQTRYILDAISNLLETGGTSLDQVVRALVILTDMRDLFAFEEVWREYFPNDPPARTVVQAGLAQLGCVVEVEVIAAIPGEGLRKEVITAPDVPAPVGHESHATKAGDFVFVSGLLPSDGKHAIAPEAQMHPNFPTGGIPVKKQTNYIIENLKKILAAAGTSIENVAAVHNYHRSMTELFPALEARAGQFGPNPPASTAVEVPNLPIPAARIMMDAYAIVP